MARRCFLTFHYKPDNWRVSQIKNMGKVEGQSILSSNGWEDVKKKGDAGIKKWIDDNMVGKTCQIVLIGKDTAGRKWINYEIEKAWNDGKGVLGIHIHNLKNADGYQSTQGANPFSGFTVGADKKPLTTWAKIYNPPYAKSDDVYNYIKLNIESWVEEAVRLRKLA